MKDVLALGVKIADEIGANEDKNTTGKWIAHYLAEKIEIAKTDPSQNNECADLIEKLWASRRNWPTGDPLERYDRLLPIFERILRTEARFFTNYSSGSEELMPGQRWLNAAVELDKSSSHLIAHFIKCAVVEMGDENKELLNLANEAEPDSQVEIIVRIKEWAEKAEEKSDPLKDNAENIRTLLKTIEDFKL